MEERKFSVIIPAYNGAEFIGKTIQSVLNQTYTNFELIIVNDASPDQTDEIISQFSDNRIKYLTHPTNQGSNTARLTGIHASNGEIIALLDQDDLIHPDKLRLHNEFLDENPDIGLSYNARFELNYSSDTIRDIWRPPKNITLADLVLGFPIAPSEVVFKKEWTPTLKLNDKSLGWTGGEIVWFGSLFLEGCQFGYVDRALNYRRHHSGRIIRDLIGGCELEISAQDRIFKDARCPFEILSLIPVAHSNIFMFWAYRAFAQGETLIGQELAARAVNENPTIIEGQPCEFLYHLIQNCDDDKNVDHEDLLAYVLNQLPSELDSLKEQSAWGIGRGYLRRATREIMWGRPQNAKHLFEQAATYNACMDDDYQYELTKKLIDYANEFGEESAWRVLESWSPYLDEFGGESFTRKLKGIFLANLAFENYEQDNNGQVPRQALKAMMHDPSHIRNKGIWSIILRSILN